MSWAQRWLRATGAPRLLVVGGASLDLIHVNGTPIPTPGGAGMYTALAAARAGVEVTMLAPLPDPMPPELAPAMERLRWVGPTVTVDGLPRFEIAYDANGAVTLFREHLGAEPDMHPGLLDLVPDLPGCAYCVPFMDARLQRDEIIGVARQHGPHVWLGIDPRLEAPRHFERDIFFIGATLADGTRIFAPMTRIKRDRHQTINNRPA